MWSIRSGLLFGLAVLAAACVELEVTNPNAPDEASAIADAETAVAMISDGFRVWHSASYAYDGLGLALSGVSFQHSSPWCNAPYSALPRAPVANEETNVNYGRHARTWDRLYGALTAAATGLRWLEEHPTEAAELGAELDRVRAFGRLVQGVAHGSLAVLYDRAFIVDETSDPSDIRRAPDPYRTVMLAALRYLDDAAALADGADWPDLPADRMSLPVSADQLARLAHSFAARYRAAVARTPLERAAVDWTAVIDDVDAGILDTWTMDMDPHDGWHNEVIDYGTYPGWAQESYFILGMADQSGSYQRWLRTPLGARVPDPDDDGDGSSDPILIVTPDTRFARGTTVAAQEANPGSLFVIPEWGIRNVWARPDRGTWRWSYYWHVDARQYALWQDFRWPEITAAEMRLLKAEGRLRDGDAAGAAALINISRTSAGLRPTDADGTNADCVPRLPDGRCGGLLEMLKWEKRLETHMKGLFGAPWYFDGRGWGDLHAGTFLQLPIPCGEIRRFAASECYTFGGAGEGTAPGSVYDWSGEVPGTTALREGC